MKRGCSRLALALLLSSGMSWAENDLTLWYKQPARAWPEALPVGNGSLGAMVFGGLPEERLQLNLDTLFTGHPHDYAHEGAVKVLPELRRLLFEGKQREAHDLGNRHFMSVNTRGSNRQEAYQPLGDLRLTFPETAPAEDYRRELDLANAVCRVRYRSGGVTYRREVFASHPDGVLVVRLTADRPGRISCRADLTSPHEGAAPGCASTCGGGISMGATKPSCARPPTRS